MNTHEIMQLRLQNQRISGKPASTPQEVVRGLGAMQSQEYAVAKWSIGLRTEGGSSDAAPRAAAAHHVALSTATRRGGDMNETPHRRESAPELLRA